MSYWRIWLLLMAFSSAVVAVSYIVEQNVFMFFVTMVMTFYLIYAYKSEE